MADPLYLSMIGWVVALLFLLFSPIWALFTSKVLSSFFDATDASKKLRELQIQTIPEVKKMLRVIEEERMLREAEDQHSDVNTLDMLAGMLRHALYEAEDILDFVDYNRIHWFVTGEPHGSIRPYAALAIGIVLVMWSGPLLWVPALLLLLLLLRPSVSPWELAREWARNSTVALCRILRTSPNEDGLPRTAAPDGEPAPGPTTTFDESVPPATATSPSGSSGWSFNFIKKCATSGSYWLDDVWDSCKQWFIDFFTITSYQENVSESSLHSFSRWKLKTRIEKVENTVSEVKKSPLYDISSNTEPKDTIHPEESKVATDGKQKVSPSPHTTSSNTIPDAASSATSPDTASSRTGPDIASSSSSLPNSVVGTNVAAWSWKEGEVGTDSEHKVFGQKALHDKFMAQLLESQNADAASSSTSQCYSVVGIYGAEGSGKTTFARYIQQQLNEHPTYKFDAVMCIHVSETFSLEDIFQEMLEDITDDSRTNISGCQELQNEVSSKFRSKRFLLILDDVWVKDHNYQELKKILLALKVGGHGSIVMLTARTEYAVKALGAEKTIAVPDMDDDEYFKMFMHYARDGKVRDNDEFYRVGEEIAKKLHKSPIAAVTVAGQLKGQPIRFWRTTAELDILDKTSGALWWSYLQLNVDIRRCFEYCNIFPRRFKLKREDLARMWIAQGFVPLLKKTGIVTVDQEDVAEGYIKKLVSCSFLQPEGTSAGIVYFRIHDLLRDIADKVSGSDFLRIENARSQSGGGSLLRKDCGLKDVHHLFLQNYNENWIAEIVKLKNLRTLMIYNIGYHVAVKDKVINRIFKRLQKLRVLIIALSKSDDVSVQEPRGLSFPQSISQLMHLRYLAFWAGTGCTATLRGSLTKLYHMHVLDFGSSKGLEFPCAYLINLRHVFCGTDMKFPHIGRLISLQTMKEFAVRNEAAYKVNQLRDLNKLRGTLSLSSLENVISKQEAVEANLAAKEGLTELTLSWGNRNATCDEQKALQADVLEALCPPMNLETLRISNYQGSGYPEWMVYKAFPHLCSLELLDCMLETLSDMDHFTSLKRLEIRGRSKIRLLPKVPSALQVFILRGCNNDFMKSCQTKGTENFEKIKNVPKKSFVEEQHENLGPLRDRKRGWCFPCYN